MGHDIGLMVAYAYAAQFPDEVDRLVLMDAFLPGVKGWEAIYNHPAIWHFRFNGATPEALVKGRERTFFEHFWNNFAADGTRSIPEADRQAYAADYARPGRMRAGWAYFVSFQQAAVDFEKFSRTKLTMPVLTIGGDKANGAALAEQGPLVATNSSSLVLANTGHWVMEESPRETADALIRFIAGEKVGQQVATPPASSLPEMRLTPDEAREIRTGSNQIGSSYLPGVSTTASFRRSLESRLLRDRVVGATEYHDSGALPPGRSDGHGRIRHLADWLRRSLRRARAQDPSAGQRLLRAWWRQSLREDWR